MIHEVCFKSAQLPRQKSSQWTNQTPYFTILNIYNIFTEPSVIDKLRGQSEKQKTPNTNNHYSQSLHTHTNSASNATLPAQNTSCLYRKWWWNKIN